MAFREPRPNEVKAIEYGDGHLLVIVKRADGLFAAYHDKLGFDEDEGLQYWARSMNALPGLFGSIEEAEREHSQLQ